jgi:hypothetical protein
MPCEVDEVVEDVRLEVHDPGTIGGIAAHQPFTDERCMANQRRSSTSPSLVIKYEVRFSLLPRTCSSPKRSPSFAIFASKGVNLALRAVHTQRAVDSKNWVGS